MYVLGFVTLHAQTNNKLQLLLKTIDNNNKNDIVNLADAYYKSDSEKYNALIYLLENIQHHKHSDYLVNHDSKLFNRISLADSLYSKIVKGKSLAEISSKPIQDSITVLQKYFRDNPYEIVYHENEYISHDDNPLENLSAQGQFVKKGRNHLTHIIKCICK